MLADDKADIKNVKERFLIGQCVCVGVCVSLSSSLN